MYLVSRRRWRSPRVWCKSAPAHRAVNRGEAPRPEHDARPPGCDSESAGARARRPRPGKESHERQAAASSGGGSLRRRPPPPTQDGLGSPRLRRRGGTAACEITGSPRAPSGNVARGSMAEDSGTNGLGVRAAERRASFHRAPLHFLRGSSQSLCARRLPIVRRTASAGRGRRPGLFPFSGPRSGAGIGYPVAARRIRLVA